MEPGSYGAWLDWSLAPLEPWLHWSLARIIRIIERNTPMSIPTTMSAIGIREPGPPDVLVPQQRDVPSVGNDTVLIRVAAAGVNMPDVLQRKGRYPVPPGATDIPGLEVAGTVVATGTGVTRFKAGDKVCALIAGGGYAEYAAADQGSV